MIRSQAMSSIRRHLMIGAAALVVLVGGIGGWATATHISGAVITSGVLVVTSELKKVQHPTGGIVGKIKVREGDHVQSGEVLVSLDDTLTRANLAIVVNSLDELSARRARLETERDGRSAIEYAPELLKRAGNADLTRMLEGERRLLELRESARLGQRMQLRQRIGQIGEEITGLAAQEVAKTREIALITEELGGVKRLAAQNLVPKTRVTELERAAARLEGERGQLVAASAQAKGRITETELQIIQIDQDLRSEVARELRDIDAKVAELSERKVTAEDQLSRVDIRAMQDGIVHQLAVHTIAGVIAPGETIMQIVPAADKLAAEVRIPPQDIDQVRTDQPAQLRLSALHQQTTPELPGRVSRISADLVEDAKTGARYYTARIELDAPESLLPADVRLMPGMPLEAFIQSADRTVLSFLIKPMSDQIHRAFRER
jgi:HlyD family secretion protein